MKDTAATDSDGQPNDPYLGNQRVRVPVQVAIREARPDEQLNLILPHLMVAGTGSDREDCVEAADQVAKQYYYGKNLLRWAGKGVVVSSEYQVGSQEPIRSTFETECYYMVDPTPTPRVMAV